MFFRAKSISSLAYVFLLRNSESRFKASSLLCSGRLCYIDIIISSVVLNFRQKGKGRIRPRTGYPRAVFSLTSALDRGG
jgi:hypothetical protein